MGISTLGDPAGDRHAMYDNTTDRAFGPVAPAEKLHAFQAWLRDERLEADARTLAADGLEAAWAEFCDDPAWVDPETGYPTEAALERAEAEA